MPTSAVAAGIYIGIEPPANPSSTVRWMSQSHRHLQLPRGKFSRRPILGNGVGQSATQECSPWWNPTLRRYEVLVNISSAQYFSYAADPWGTWSTPVKVLGGNTGGETGNAQQCSVYVENGNLYAIYITGSSTTYKMAKAAMPAAVGATPSFSVLGSVFVDTSSTTGTARVINVGGTYYLFAERGGNLKLATSSAANMDGLIATPFTIVATKLTALSVNGGFRYGVSSWGRPFPVFEPSSGTWILYVHGPSFVDFGDCSIWRFTCQDKGIPINWTVDVASPFNRQVHQLEVDTVVDPAFVQGDDEKWWAFWTGTNNPGVAFSIFCSPLTEPMLSYGGNEWGFTQFDADPLADLGYINPDIINANATLQNQWDCVFDTSSAAITATFPIAASHSFMKLSNYPATLPGNPVKLIPGNTTDKILGGNPITAISAVGTTVTVTTKRPHNLTTSDFVTVTGCTPTGYNVNGVAVASVVDSLNFTYTAGSSPAAISTIGVYDWSLEVGETRRYRVRGTQNQRMWCRA